MSQRPTATATVATTAVGLKEAPLNEAQAVTKSLMKLAILVILGVEGKVPSDSSSSGEASLAVIPQPRYPELPRRVPFAVTCMVRALESVEILFVTFNSTDPTTCFGAAGADTSCSHHCRSCRPTQSWRIRRCKICALRGDLHVMRHSVVRRGPKEHRNLMGNY